MKIFSNLATSLDGKIATASRVHFPLGTPADRKMMITLRKQCDVVIFGASTLRAFKKPCSVKGGNRAPWNAVISSTLEGFSTEWPFFKDTKLKRFLFVSEETPRARIEKFSQNSTVIVLKKSSPPSTARQVVQQLAKLGAKRLLVEGGGGVMWDFVSENLIDEYYVTLTPRILGGTEAPTLVEGLGFEPKEVINLKLKKVKKLGHELYLVYTKTKHRGP